MLPNKNGVWLPTLDHRQILKTKVGGERKNVLIKMLHNMGERESQDSSSLLL